MNIGHYDINSLMSAGMYRDLSMDVILNIKKPMYACLTYTLCRKLSFTRSSFTHDIEFFGFTNLVRST